MSIANIQADFAVLDDWEDRYRYVIELGRALPAMPEGTKTDLNKVRGCASQVWLDTRFDAAPNGDLRLTMVGDSDAHIVRGLIAILRALYHDLPAREILTIDPNPVFRDLGLDEHLTPQRSNGLAAMVERIRHDARAAADTARAEQS